MKLLHVGPKSIHVSSYAEALRNEGISQFLLSEEPCGFSAVKEEFTVDFHSMSPLALMKAAGKVKEILKALKPDIVHIHQVTRMAYFVSKAAQKAGIPVISTAWGSDVLLVPQKNAFFRFLVTQTLKRSRAVTADSQEMILAMQKLAPSESRYHWLQYGIVPVPPVVKENIIFSNRLLRPLYRIDRIIGYFSEFSKENKEWKLVVGGTGDEEKRLRAQVKDLRLDDKVEFTGWLLTPQNRDWYARSAIYVSIPESDGTSVSLLEAMSAGCVPVVSDLGVSAEWITDGKNGVIEKPGSNPLTEALVLNREKAVEENRRIIDERATREQSVRVFMSLYKQLLARQN